MDNLETALGEFAQTLLHAVTNTHILHWRIIDKSEPAHRTLGAFYEGLQEKVDAVVENIMGKYQCQLPIQPNYYPPLDDPKEELHMLSDYVTEARTTLPPDSEIQNLIDEIQDLINKTRYLLRAP
jgi:hypothetical protein